MTVPQFSRPGAVDLSALRKPAAPAGGGALGASGGSGPGTGAYVVEVVDEQSLRTDVVERSLSVLVLVSFWSAAQPDSVEINATLSRLADKFAGRFVLATVDVGTRPQLGQALGIPEVPLVVAALRGQLAPLVQQSLPEAEMESLIEQVLQAAVANGITGRADPVGPSSGGSGDQLDEPPAEPPSKFPAAEEALMSGDLETAITAYEDALASAPGDPEALLGLAQAKLLKRTAGLDPTATREAAAQNPNDVSAQALAADLDLMGGHVDDAFGRLIDVVRRMSGDERDAARRHLVDLFAVVGDADPRVLRARQQLASALF